MFIDLSGRTVKKLLVLLFGIFYFLNIYSQDDDYEWWVIKHNWDYHTQWNHYMTTSAAYFGPNALPVPDLRDGRVEQEYRFELRPEAHLSKGDQTYDIYTSIIIPLAKVASFQVFLVPSEYYKMDTITRDERFARHINAEGYAGGDFWFGTNIQIVKDRIFPDLIFSAYFKTASGTTLSDARYTDAPAYYMLLNGGKDVKQFGETNLRLYGHLGVYIWQTWSDVNSQDDAFAYGFGTKLYNNNFYATAELSAYHGYLNIGDRPAVVRVQYGLIRNKHEWVFRCQQGINDFKYLSLSVAYIYTIKI
jgi:hypothetical protein